MISSLRMLLMHISSECKPEGRVRLRYSLLINDINLEWNVQGLLGRWCVSCVHCPLAPRNGAPQIASLQRGCALLRRDPRLVDLVQYRHKE